VKAFAVSASKPTIIIAAFNEANVIGRTIEQLRDSVSESFQVIVVCNGCTDNTEAILRNEYPDIHCLSMETASKALAIRLAESLSPGFPRVYLDADIVLPGKQALALIDYARQRDKPGLIVPRSVIDSKASSSMVQRYYRAWYRTPHVQLLGYGAGVYVVNEAARQRFGVWPDLIADDAFIRSQFEPSEIEVVDFCDVTVMAPKSLWWLIKVKTRSKLGNLQLRALSLTTSGLSGNNRGAIDLSVAETFRRIPWSDRFSYGLVNAVALLMAKWNFYWGKTKWQRDDSNR